MSAATITQEDLRIPSVIMGAVLLLVAIVLWVFPLTISRRILPRAESDHGIQANSGELAKVAVGLFGLWLVAISGRTLLWYVTRLLLFTDPTSGPLVSQRSPEVKADLFMGCAEIVLGFAIIKQSGAIARWISKHGGEQ
jgi:drug/metabolite transporter (DMT)-like permease